MNEKEEEILEDIGRIFQSAKDHNRDGALRSVEEVAAYTIHGLFRLLAEAIYPGDIKAQDKFVDLASEKVGAVH